MKVTMLAGNTGGEFLNALDVKDEQELENEARKLFGDRANAFLAIPESHVKTEGVGYGAASGIECTVKGVLADRAKDGENGYCYCFDPDMPGWDNPGTFHSSDLWFWFETLAKCWRPFVGRHYDLARQMCDYFCNFIRTGNPNGKDQNGEMLPHWDTWSEKTPCTMQFTGDGAEPMTAPLPPLKVFLQKEIMERMKNIPV